MIKVFLVEDEVVIRNGIKNSIHWEQEGFEFAGEASDGELAYPLILKAKPDILITDIKMPFMDGLELSEAVKKQLPSTKILILSGYNDFDFAKKAITIGITDYLLKPISAEQLLKALRDVAEVIEREREERELFLKYEEDMQENREREKREFLTRILTKNLPVTEILEQGKQLGIDLRAAVYNMLLFKMSIVGDETDSQSRLGEAMAAVEDFMKGFGPGIEYFQYSIEGWAILFLAEEMQQIEDMVNRCRERLREILKAYPNNDIEYFGAIGKPVYRLRELKESYEEAERLMTCRYLEDGNQIIQRDELRREEGQHLNLNSLKMDYLNRGIIENFLKTGLQSEVSQFIGDYFDSLGKKNMKSLLFRQYVVMDMYFAAASMLEQVGYTSQELVERCGDFQTMANAFGTEKQSKEYMKKVFDAAIEMRDAVSQKRYASVLEEARKYIKENLDNKNISLNTVAASVNISPNHFSAIFSQEMGQTFVEYLTGVRMERAKELLRSTAMRTTDIAFEVGYKDPHYFSYLFKKTQECTPREFRSQTK